MTCKFLSLIIAGVVIVFGLPVPSLAAEFHSSEDRVSLVDDIKDNLYTAGGSVSVDSNVEGDLFAAGGDVRIGGSVRDDLFVGAGSVDIEGIIDGDVRIAGGQVQLSGDVRGELFVFGGQVEITEEARIEGDVYVFGGQLIVAGTTGNIQAAIGGLIVESTAIVNGDLSYTTKEEIEIPDGATVTGSVVYRTSVNHPQVSSTGLFSAFLAGGAIWLLASVVMAIVLGYGFPHKSQVLMISWRKNFGKNLIWGFVFLIVTPIAALVLMASTIGFPLGVILFGVFGLIMYIGRLVAALAVGAWVQSWWDKKAHGVQPVWSAAVIGVIALAVVSIIPVLGGFAVFVTFLVGVGAVAQYDWALLKKMRSDKLL